MMAIDIDIGKAAYVSDFMTTWIRSATWWSFQAAAHCIEVQWQCQRQLLSGCPWGTWLEMFWCRLLGTSCPIQIRLHFFIDSDNVHAKTEQWVHDITMTLTLWIEFENSVNDRLIQWNLSLIWGVMSSTGDLCLRNLWHARCDNKACQFNFVLSESDAIS